MKKKDYLVLTRSRGFKVLIDRDDFENLTAQKIYIKVNPKHSRAIATKYISPKPPRYKSWYLSRLLMNCPEDMVVDHINGNALDNRRSNLRICTYSQNMMNKKRSKRNSGGTSKHKGVYKCANKTKPWVADIKANRKLVWREFFKTEKEAAIARDKKAKEIHGEFAWVNFK